MRKKFNYNFLSKRNLWISISAIFVFLSIGSLVTQGLQLGTDFSGGASVSIEFPNSVEAESVRTMLVGTRFESAKLQTIGIGKEVLLKVAPDFLEESKDDIKTDIEEIMTDGKVVFIDMVGPQISSELTEDGILALIYALGGILIYVMVRFTSKFAFGAVLAVVHDIVVSLGIFSMLRLEFDLTVLAAFLAVIGYSLNDTIVVFDRVRENFKTSRSEVSSEVIINLSINQTLSRTLVTSGTTLVVVFALFLLGGDMIKNFSIALGFGVIVGTYSSIYVAGSTLMFLELSRDDFLSDEQNTEDV
ncbi:MAG: protein translocase subunit SecF [Methylococcaceae bacterium TMED69]|nr:MAG: protein translocase subunit SecF [Methylococcaceae bacterium TMED69]|tara:strand:- start:1332 stop:2240 length:909 start_codon:yes stop_codon:yes gene_type:complete